MSHSSQENVTGIAVYLGQAHSLHLTQIPLPDLRADEILVEVQQVGVCGTDREIIEAKFGTPPPGTNELIIGHEVIGRVVSTGDHVTTIRAGDLVVPTVRRPDDCPACLAGQSDFCLWRGYKEHGIIGLHGFMVNRFVAKPEYVVPVPAELEPIGILLEPLSVVEKASRVARAVQTRLDSWTPATAVILGAGPIGLLGTLLLRAEGFDVYTVARKPGPHLASSIVESSGAHYVSSSELSLTELGNSIPNVDLIIECTGQSEPVFEGMALLGGNGVLALLSLTGGDRSLSVPADAINREFVLGNKLMVGSVNSHRDDFVAGISHLSTFESLWPGLTHQLITHRFHGFEDALNMMSVSGIKSVIEVA